MEFFTEGVRGKTFKVGKIHLNFCFVMKARNIMMQAQLLYGTVCSFH